MSERYLPTALRRTLERVIKNARIAAEDGARDAIRRLGVADSKAPRYLSNGEKELRRRLRAHARALGDPFDRKDETQATKHLIEAAAYAHWHRRLFARFLAERGLLRNPEYDVAVTLEDCRELAEAEGLTDHWAIAEQYSAAMLPAVFRIDDPVLALELDPVHTQKLQQLVTGLDAEVFKAEDSLGWTYQFWRAAEKDAVNASGVKIGADELPAVTQLFTEPYMVRFLLHNTLGAWWAGKVLADDPTLAQNAEDEDALRVACSLPECSFNMLRFVREGEDGPWRPAAGTFPGWPTEVKAITMLDPCCGSGHFLTEALAILTALRQAEEQLSSADAVAAVLRDNLHGLEIDGRCVQIAAFAVALTAWRIGGWQTLPLPHIAWVGAPPPLPKREFLALAGGDLELEYALAALHDLFAMAPLLGMRRAASCSKRWRRSWKVRRPTISLFGGNRSHSNRSAGTQTWTTAFA
jgi:restriction-modification enzyme MmeI-like protein